MHFDTMRELLATTEAKVLLAVDEYNELYQPSHWHYGDNKASRATSMAGGGGGGTLYHTWPLSYDHRGGEGGDTHLVLALGV